MTKNINFIERSGISTETIDRINRFSQFAAKLAADFDWTVCQQYLARRAKLTAVLAEHWNQTEKSALGDVQSLIEQDCAQKLFIYGRKTLRQDSEGKSHPASFTKKNLAWVLEVAGMQIASLFEAIRALMKYQDYYLRKEKELLAKSNKTPLAEKMGLLSRLESVTGDLSLVIPKLTQTATAALVEMKRFMAEFADELELLSERAHVLTTYQEHIEFCLSSSLFSGSEPCKTNLPIYLDGEEIVFDGVDFDSVDIYSLIGKAKQSIQFRNCKGSVSLTGVQRGGQLGFIDCPTLSVEVVHSQFEQVDLGQYVNAVKLESVQAKELSVTANVSQLTLEDCRIDQTTVSMAAVDNISLLNSKTRIEAKTGATVGYLGLDESSTASILASNSRIGHLKPGKHAHVIAHDACIDEIDLQETSMAFIDHTRSQLADIKRNEVGLYQEIKAPDGSQYTLMSAQTPQQDCAEKLNLSEYRSKGQAAYLTDLIADDWRAAEFYDLARSQAHQTNDRTIMKSAALSLTRSGVTPRDTAWDAMLASEYVTFDDGVDSVAELTQDVACADFMLWRADHFPEEHTKVVANLSTKKRIAALHYMKEAADRKLGGSIEIRQEMSRFNGEIAGIAVLAKAWRLIAEYQPGEMSSWAKHKAKHKLMNQLQQLIVDEELSAAEIAKRSLLLFQESRKTFSGAWQQGKVMATFFGLAEQMIQKYQKSCIRAMQIDDIIEKKLKDQQPEICKRILARYLKYRETMILTEAVSTTLHEMGDTIARSQDAEQVAALNSICARQASIEFKSELTGAKQIETMLDQVYRLATAYSPIIAISGPGKQKLKIMRQLASLVSNSSCSAVNRSLRLSSSLKILQQQDESRQKETENPFVAGFALWTKRSRASRGYKVILTKIASLLDSCHTPIFRPKKQVAGDLDHFVVPDMDQALMARQDRLFKKRRELRQKDEKRKKQEEITPIRRA